MHETVNLSALIFAATPKAYGFKFDMLIVKLSKNQNEHLYEISLRFDIYDFFLRKRLTVQVLMACIALLLRGVSLI